MRGSIRRLFALALAGLLLAPAAAFAAPKAKSGESRGNSERASRAASGHSDEGARDVGNGRGPTKKSSTGTSQKMSGARNHAGGPDASKGKGARRNGARPDDGVAHGAAGKKAAVKKGPKRSRSTSATGQSVVPSGEPSDTPRRARERSRAASESGEATGSLDSTAGPRGRENAFARITENLQRAAASMAAGTRRALPPGLVRVWQRLAALFGVDAGSMPGASPVQTPQDEEPIPTTEPTGTVPPTPTVPPTAPVTGSATPGS